MIIFIDNITPRIRYVFDFIFKDVLGVEYEFTTDRKKFEQKEDEIRLSYTRQLIDDEAFVNTHPILFEREIKKQEIIVTEHKDLKVFFQTDRDAFIEFDIYAATFFLLSRYEEYYVADVDKHGRFPVEASLALDKKFIQRPVVDEWIFYMAAKLKQKYPAFEYKKRNFTYLPTIDIDNAFKYRFKGFSRTLSGFFNDFFSFNFKQIAYRYKVLRGQLPDPYNTYDVIEDIHSTFDLKPLFFFLIGQYGKFDKNVSVKRKKYQALLKTISEKYTIGAHPSYRSSLDDHVLETEIRNLEKFSGRKIDISRQHYLKFRLPNTYRKLLAEGIKADYSMGYPYQLGFRASTCTPFYFYDLQEEQQTDLSIYPFQIMDASLTDIKKSSTDYWEEIKSIIDKIIDLRGTFITIWHNDAFASENNELQELYVRMLDYIDQQKKMIKEQEKKEQDQNKTKTKTDFVDNFTQTDRRTRKQSSNKTGKK